ncbi:hypothetical protein PO124_24595 [Bacillus licheniformis]|nr:hypothetical protein [Bacillus licheniformis]
MTEISAVVEQIERIQAEMGIEKLPSPWLPPLEERIPKRAIRRRKPMPLTLPISMNLKAKPGADQLPHDGRRQYRHRRLVRLRKSLTATTFMMSFAEQYTPEELHYYISTLATERCFRLQGFRTPRIIS